LGAQKSTAHKRSHGGGHSVNFATTKKLNVTPSANDCCCCFAIRKLKRSGGRVLDRRRVH